MEDADPCRQLLRTGAPATISVPASTADPAPRGTPALRLLIATEVRLYREGLATSLAERPEADVVGSAASGEEAVEALRRASPDMVLLDPDLPGAAEVLREARREPCGAAVVALAIHASAEGVVACAEAGMAGYVDRSASIDDLIRTLAAVARGEVPCPPRIAGSLFRRVGTLSRSAPPEVDVLTPREREVLSLIDAGCSNKEIARRLHIGLSTVKNHVHNLLGKLGAERRGAAAARLRSGPAEPSRSLAP
jgi:two-component system, NarL family, nitrate/nitrite response regulator NarL